VPCIYPSDLQPVRNVLLSLFHAADGLSITGVYFLPTEHILAYYVVVIPNLPQVCVMASLSLMSLCALAFLDCTIMNSCIEPETWLWISAYVQVVLMSWVHEHLPSAAHTKVWQRKFLVLRKMQLQIFASPPVVILQQHSCNRWKKPLCVTIYPVG